MIKKISALILALVLCLSVMVVPVSAAGVELGDAQIAFRIEWDKESYSAGETAVLSVYMDASDDLSLYTGSFLIGVNSAVFPTDINTQAAIREGSTTSELFNSYYKAGESNLSVLASSVVPKVQAKNTAEENELYDWYIKFTAAKNTGGSHPSVGTTKEGFYGSDFDPEEPILTISLVVGDSVADGTVVNAAMTSGSVTCSPAQTAWKYYKTPGSATTTANVATSAIDVAQAVATPAVVGEVAPACDHSADKITWTTTTAATCTADGLKTGTCSCGEYTTTEVIKATGHNMVAGEVVAPTCTADGYTVYTCANGCGTTENKDTVAATGHKYDTVVTAPTCTEQGYTTYTCACGDTYKDNYVDATGHSYTSAETQAPTCTEAGVMTYTCACGDTYTEEIAATGHTYEAVVTAPTCTADGYTTYTCACGDTYTDDVVAATGHSYTEEITVAPTYGAAGVKTFTCTCGDSYTEVIEALTLTVKHAGSQIIFKTQGGKYVGKFDVRAVAALKKAEFEAAFGTDGSNIVKAGFVFAAGSNVTAPSMDDVKAIVENGATVEGYSEYQVSKISTTLVKGAYSWTCLVKNIPDADKADSLVAVGFIAWDVDGDGAADAYAYYDGAQTVSFEALYDQYFPW